MRSVVCGGRPGFNAASGVGGRDRRGGLKCNRHTFEFNQVHHIASSVHHTKTPRLQTAIHLHVFLPVIVHLCTASAHQLTSTALPSIHPMPLCNSVCISLTTASFQCMYAFFVFFLSKTLRERWYVGIKVGNTQHKNGPSIHSDGHLAPLGNHTETSDLSFTLLTTSI